MMGQLYLHIGPPKTATTTLQHSLQSAEIPGLAYLGVTQPRQKYHVSPSRLLHQIAQGKIALNDPVAKELRSLIEVAAFSNSVTVISEEMFLVWEYGASFEEKLGRVFLFLKGTPVTVLLTVRDPKFAIPSYYQEIFKSLPIKIQKNMEEFEGDIRASCFDYSAVIEFVEEKGIKVNVVDFNDITSGIIQLTTLFGSDCGLSGSLSTRQENVGRRGATGKRIIPALTARGIGRNLFVRRIIDFLNLRRAPGWHHLAELFDKIPIVHATSIDDIDCADMGGTYQASFEKALRQLAEQKQNLAQHKKSPESKAERN